MIIWTKYWVLFLSLLVLNNVTFGQKDSIVFEENGEGCLKVAYDDFTCDNLGNLYYFHKDELVKYNLIQDSTIIFSDKVLGNIHWVDVSFPLKPIVFFDSKSQIQVLDNTLSPQGATIDLSDYDIFGAEAVCSSYENNSIWVFTTDNQEIVKLNYSTKTNSRTGNLNNLLGKEVNILYLIEKDNYLYANNDGNELLVFDINGTYVKSIALKVPFDFQIIKGNIAYTDSEQVFRLYNLKSFESFTKEVEEGWKKIMFPYSEFKLGEFYIMGYEDKICFSVK